MNSEKYTLQLETEGRLTIPDSVRQRLGLEKKAIALSSLLQKTTKLACKPLPQPKALVTISQVA